MSDSDSTVLSLNLSWGSTCPFIARVILSLKRPYWTYSYVDTVYTFCMHAYKKENLRILNLKCSHFHYVILCRLDVENWKPDNKSQFPFLLSSYKVMSTEPSGLEYLDTLAKICHRLKLNAAHSLRMAQSTSQTCPLWCCTPLSKLTTNNAFLIKKGITI